MSREMKMRPGDWMCPNCDDHQFGRNAKCRKCDTAKPEPGSEAIKKEDQVGEPNTDDAKAPAKRDRQTAEGDAKAKRAKVDEADWDKTKICLFGVGKFTSKFALAEFIDKKKLSYKKILKLKNQGYALLSFANEADASKVCYAKHFSFTLIYYLHRHVKLSQGKHSKDTSCGASGASARSSA